VALGIADEVAFLAQFHVWVIDRPGRREARGSSRICEIVIAI
jgi:hypothetical protein